MAHDRPAASAWIEATEIQLWNEPALGIYARAIARERPEEAMERAQRISDPELRKGTMVAIARVWIRNDRAAAQAWLANADVPERVRRASASAGEDRARQGRRARAAPEVAGPVPD